MGKTLEELKAENAAAETIETEEAPQAEENEIEEVEAVEEETQEPEEIAESVEDDSEETEIEEWAKVDDAETQEPETMPVAAHAKVRAKLKAKIEEDKSEIESLKAEVESLKSKPQQAVINTSKPKREDFYDQDDPDEAYLEALSDWKIETRLSSQAKKQQEDQQAEQQRKQIEAINRSVDDHYERAAKLSEQSGITADAFQAADLRVKQTLEAARPGAGEMLTNFLISNLGEGSEKVMYHLGVNKTALNELQASFINDPSGIQAAMLLGAKKAQLTAPTKRVSQARKPAVKLEGDASSKGDTQANQGALRKKYNEAHKKGNTQLAFNIKRQAKQSNINTTQW